MVQWLRLHYASVGSRGSVPAQWCRCLPEEQQNEVFNAYHLNKLVRLDGVIDTMDMSLSKLREMVKDVEAWWAAVPGVTKSQTQQRDWTTTTMENSMEVLRKTKTRVAIWLSDSIPGHISRENYNLKRYPHPYVHSRTIYNSQDTETSYMSTGRVRNKEDVIPYTQ